MKSRQLLGLFFMMTLFLFTACKKDEIPMPKEEDLITKISELDPYLSKVMDQYDMMSLSAAIVKNDQLIWSKGYGFANKELNKNATNDTPYLIASISKTVTGVAVMQLVEQGKIDLDADINAYLPFKITNPKNPDVVITARHLLTHTSGITDNHYGKIAYDNLYYFDKDPDISLAGLFKAFFTANGKYYSPQSFVANAPGTSYNYTNIGFALLGYIVERAAKQPFDQFTKENIFTPLGMSHTSWRLKDFNLTDIAMPYDVQNKPYGHYTFADYPNGGLFSSVNDLSKFLRAFMNRGTLNGKKILSEASVKEMQKFQYLQVKDAEKQGLAWNGENYETGKNMIGHLGGEQGVNTLMYFNRDTNVGVIIFLNKDFAKEEDAYSQLNIFLHLANVGEKSEK